eukprot:2135278-Prymnesium_polylepis.1
MREEHVTCPTRLPHMTCIFTSWNFTLATLPLRSNTLDLTIGTTSTVPNHPDRAARGGAPSADTECGGAVEAVGRVAPHEIAST